MSYQERQLAGGPLSNRDDIYLRLANALQKLTEGASPAVGSDCFLHAKLAQAILSEIGIQTEIVAGESAWRTGPGDQDIIAHSPQVSGFAFGPGNPLPIHVWLKTEQGDILDFTTHSLKAKARLLDENDGGQTAVQWCPPYLLAKPHVSTLDEVTQAPVSGVFHYREFPGLLDLLVARGIGATEVDAEDLAVLRLLFRNPETHLVGPNHMNQMGAFIEDCLTSARKVESEC